MIIQKKKFLINNKSINQKRKKMKKLIITAVLILVSSPFFAQSAFDKFDGQDDVTSIVVNKKMFELMSKVKVDASDKETQQYLNLIKKLDTVEKPALANSLLISEWYFLGNLPLTTGYSAKI